MITELKKATQGERDGVGLVNVLEEGIRLEETRYARRCHGGCCADELDPELLFCKR